MAGQIFSASRTRILLGASLSFSSSVVWAGSLPGAIVEYEPLAVNAATAVPTLGEWTLILMALLVAVVAYRALRGRVNGRLLSNLIVAGGAAAFIGGHGGIKKAEADVATFDVDLPSRTGGNVNVQTDVVSYLNNVSGVALRIKSITLTRQYLEILPAGSEWPQCAVGLVITPANKCEIFIRSLPV